jgi:hypothetical protein
MQVINAMGISRPDHARTVERSAGALSALSAVQPDEQRADATDDHA